MAEEKIYHRFKTGRPAIFETAEDLWRAALEYFKWCDEHPMQVSVRDKKKASSNGDKSAEKQYEDVPRPYTLDGLHIFINMHTPWNVFKANCRKRKDADEFNTVISACEDCIRNQQVSGAMIGLYSERLTARLNGITEKVDATVNQRNTTVTWEEFQAMLDGAKE